MADRLTQLQMCLDQLVEQFNATVNYVNSSSEPAMLDDDPTSVANIAASAPLPGQQQPPQQPQSQTQTAQQQQSPHSPSQSNAQTQQASSNGSNKHTVSNHPSVRAEAESNFENTINELSTDIILKSRQISMLIDSLPGIGVSPESQLKIIEELSEELQQVEQEHVKKIEEKDKLLKWCESLIVEVATGIAETRQ
ncbi:DNA-directed RNA polymerase II holoenzyme and kornberg s mediator [Scheffersomyces xylosifermentans]|uniref:DNA-directed RNA polymerase II holoenzyme and kornberg s mediator n=1 Tax=Scheffersomyces xylosifermentans TaxID=1304137 RepID=UPI00315CE378